MTEQPVSMSPIKLGFAVAWSAFWTGVPAKIALILLLLAAGLHPWESPGVALLLLLSIPIDLWAVGLSARTVFLERLRLQPPEGLGLALWWRGMLLNAVYLPLAYFIQSETTSLAKAVAARIMDLDLLKHWPVAEKISIELTLWGSVSTLMLIILILGWLCLFGLMVRRQAAAARPADESYPALVRQWDLLRVPADQPLLLTAFTLAGVLMVFLFWAFMPVTTPHPHELYKKDVVKVAPFVKPADALLKSEKVLAQAEAALQALEEQKAKEAKEGKGKKKDKPPAPAKATPAKADSSKPAKG
jgi:hypothetical protein